jgi:hypothetical protein
MAQQRRFEYYRSIIKLLEEKEIKELASFYQNVRDEPILLIRQYLQPDMDETKNAIKDFHKEEKYMEHYGCSVDRLDDLLELMSSTISNQLSFEFERCLTEFTEKFENCKQLYEDALYEKDCATEFYWE